MQHLTWLHLSDWHQSDADFDRTVVLDALLNDVRARQKINPALAQVDFVIFSGDLARSGKPAEYNAARQNLLDPVLRAVDLVPQRLFIVPGNHDLDRDAVAKLPEVLQQPLASDDQVEEWLTDDGKRECLLAPFEAFTDFVTAYTGQTSPDYACIAWPMGDPGPVALLGLNSAWMCARHRDEQNKAEFDDKGYALVGEPQLHEALAKIAGNDIRIAVMHHPFEWLADFDRDNVERWLKRKAHFILRGHEHRPEVQMVSGTEGQYVIIPAGASYDRRLPDNPRGYYNAYNWVHLDLATGKGTVYLRRWSDRRHEWIEDTDTVTEGKFMLKSLPEGLGAASSATPVDIYLDAMRDYCANLPYLTLRQNSPQKALDEVYVPLKARAKPRENEARPEPEAQEVASRPLSIAEMLRQSPQRHLLVFGGPGVGKSTLLRQLAQHARDAPQSIGLEVPHLPLLVPLHRLAQTEGPLEERLRTALNAELSLMQALPEGFFAEWPRETGLPWLLLLDALDEVPGELRARLMQWLKGVFKQLGPHRVVITARPGGYLAGEIDEGLFGQFDLLPFTPDQTDDLARKWFGEDAPRFLVELKRVRAGPWRDTPLLLTIAAQVFLQKKTLPAQRSGLYDRFVETWLQEAALGKGWQTELHDYFRDLAKPALGKLAWAMTESPDKVALADLEETVAAYLRSALTLSPDKAHADGRRLLQSLTRNSGVLTRQGERCDFIHPTFREFLAAWVTVNDHRQEPDQIWRRLISRWGDRNWQGTALFALSILSESDKDVTDFVRRIFETGSEEAIYCAGLALAQEAKIQPALGEQIIQSLFSTAKAIGRLGISRTDSIALLRDLRSWPTVTQGLLELVWDETISSWVRERIVEVLGQWEQREELLSLAKNEQTNVLVRVRAADMLCLLGCSSETIPILLALTQDSQIPALGRIRAAETLGRYGHAHEARLTLVTLARAEKTDPLVGGWAMETLGRLGKAEAVLELVSDPSLLVTVREAGVDILAELAQTDALATILHDQQFHPWLRERAAERMTHWGRKAEAVPVLLELARDTQISPSVSERAIDALGRLDRTDDLRTFVFDDSLRSAVRAVAISALSTTGHASELLAMALDERADEVVQVKVADVLGIAQRIEDLVVLASSEKVAPVAREIAAENLGHLGQGPQAMIILSALMHNKRVAAEVRLSAATMLCELGSIVEGETALLAFAHSQYFESRERRRAIEILGRFARVGVLPDLNQIVSDDGIEDVRQAARDAISQIRVRESAKR